MLFNSYTFFIFFAIVLFFSQISMPWRARKTLLLIASYLFYSAWNPPFVMLLWFSTILDWFLARGMRRSHHPLSRKLMLGLSLAGNLGVLAVFKYGGFLLDNFIWMAQAVGWDFQPARPDIILPVGISFYTFQTLSYTIDVYRRTARPSGSFLDFALYVTFFPQLVAGPIVRATDFLPQCEQPRRASRTQLGWGLCLLMLGLFQKVFIADTMMAPVVESVYNASASVSFLAAWMGTLAFATQIFCDFSGYSSCAIGVAMCLGFSLPDNFRFPYASLGFSDFWRRWHISLSSWLRDYLYIPLGGNRTTRVRTHANLLATMLLGGLWHGACWTFVFWGALHGSFLIIERAARKGIGHWTVWRAGTAKPALMILTFLCICITWVFFRADSFHRAFDLLHAMFRPDLTIPCGTSQGSFLLVACATTALLVMHYLLRDITIERAAAITPLWLRSVLLALMMCLVVMSLSGEDRAFIYFQF